MNDMGVEIIKNRIEHGKCRLVLLEIPLTLSFHINRYLEGDERFKPDSIASYFDKVLFSSSSFVSLMRWVKEYNRHLEEKVSFFGIDRNIYRLQSSIDAVQRAIEEALGIEIRVLDYNEHALRSGSGAQAASYIHLMDVKSGRATYGVGISSNITRASIRGIFSAVNRLFY